MISNLQFSVASVTAQIKDFNIIFIKPNLEPAYPIIRIKTDEYDRAIEENQIKIKKSNRGRKKKKVKDPEKFKSNISFEVKLILHRRPKIDSYSRIVNSCKIHADCEYFPKTYNIRIFNGGTIICVGILKQDKSDFLECIRIIFKFLVKNKLNSFSFLNPRLMPFLKQKFKDQFEILNIHSTLENYQFMINKAINLYALKAFFIKNSREKVVNIDFTEIYIFITDNITQDNYDLNIDMLLHGIERKNKVRISIVNKKVLQTELTNLDLKKLHLEFEEFWIDFRKRNKNFVSDQFLKCLKYNLLKQFIIFKFKPIKIRCEMQEDAVVDSVIFKETKNTLIVKKTLKNKEITFRIFGTGIIDIQGGNSYEISKLAMDKISVILIEPYIYDADRPPMVTWQQLLKPFNIN